MAAVEYPGLGGSAWCSGPKEAYLSPHFALLVLFFLFLFGCTLYGWGQQTAAAHTNRGLQLAQAGDLRGAESELRTAVGLAPQNPEFLTDLATVLAMERKLEESNIYFERALKLHPGNLIARRYLAANLWQLHRYADARRNLELILKENNNDASSRLLMGMVAENMKDYRTATQMLASVPEEVRKQPESIAALAMSYYQLGEKVQAQSTLEELQNHPAGERAALLGAQIADEMTDYDTAERLLSSLESNSRDQAVGYRLAAVQYRAGRFEKSEKTLLRLVASGNETGQIFNLLGWCYEKRNQPEQAQQAFERGISVQPNDQSNYLDLQKILMARDHLAAALEVAKRTTDALPSSARAFAMRGLIEMRTSQFSNAVSSYRQAAELDPASSDSALGLADAEFASDMVKDAQTRYEAGIKQFPEDPRFRIHYASALLKQAETGDPTAQGRAQELLKSAVKLDPSSADAYVQLGEIALANGQTGEALEDYGRAAKLSPENATVHFGLSKVYRRLGKSEEASRETKLFEKLQQSASQSPTSLPGENQHN